MCAFVFRSRSATGEHCSGGLSGVRARRRLPGYQRRAQPVEEASGESGHRPTDAPVQGGGVGNTVSAMTITSRITAVARAVLVVQAVLEVSMKANERGRTNGSP